MQALSHIKSHVQTKCKSLDRKRLPATTCAGGIGIIEIKPLAIQSSRKLKRGIAEVQKTPQISHNPHTIVIKDLVIGSLLVVEIHLVRQAGTASADDTYAYEVVFRDLPGLADLANLFLCAFCHKQHNRLLLYWFTL